jgi:cytochrome c-type biogenesis protein CcmE
MSTFSNHDTHLIGENALKPKIIIGTIVIIGALGYLNFSGFKDSSVYYMTVTELNQKKASLLGEGLRISGYVIPSSIDWDAERIQVRFTMFEGRDSLKVIYKGIKPDQLADAQQVLAEGKLNSQGEFQASKLLLKCPSKYESKLDETNINDQR